MRESMFTLYILDFKKSKTYYLEALVPTLFYQISPKYFTITRLACITRISSLTPSLLPIRPFLPRLHPMFYQTRQFVAANLPPNFREHGVFE